MSKMALADCSGVGDAVIPRLLVYIRSNSPRGRVPFLWAPRREGFDLAQITVPRSQLDSVIAARGHDEHFDFVFWGVVLSGGSDRDLQGL